MAVEHVDPICLAAMCAHKQVVAAKDALQVRQCPRAVAGIQQAAVVAREVGVVRPSAIDRSSKVETVIGRTKTEIIGLQSSVARVDLIPTHKSIRAAAQADGCRQLLTARDRGREGRRRGGGVRGGVCGRIRRGRGCRWFSTILASGPKIPNGAAPTLDRVSVTV